MTIPEFITACDLFCSKHGKTRVWLSKRLFSDTNRIDVLAGDEAQTDVGVRRLEKAVNELAALDQHLSTASQGQAGSPEQRA